MECFEPVAAPRLAKKRFPDESGSLAVIYPSRFKATVTNVIRALRAVSRRRYWSYELFSKLPEYIRAVEFCRRWIPVQHGEPAASPLNASTRANPLWSYFDSHKEGRVIFKWVHYFDIYERHFSKFAGRDVHVVEIGVLGGGSLEMWHHYFGPKCRVTGVDIDPRCKAYEDGRTAIFIGNQEDRQFWKSFREQAPPVDILIDDGGHTPEQQMVTLEEMLPYIRPGGVYLCEDVHGVSNRFAAYAHALADNINTATAQTNKNPEFPLTSQTVDFQAAVSSVHFYPFVVVIEKTVAAVKEFACRARGTQ